MMTQIMVVCRLHAARQLLPDDTKAAASCVTDPPPVGETATAFCNLLVSVLCDDSKDCCLISAETV